MVIEFTLGDMVEGLSTEGKDNGGGRRLSDRGGLCLRTWRTHNRNPHVHTKCAMFDGEVLRCLLADLVVGEETAGGFLGHLCVEGINNLCHVCEDSIIC